jgi:hypothetical protein
LEKLKAIGHLEDLSVDGKIILEWILAVEWGDTDWIHLARNRGQCRDLVNIEIKFLFQ